MAFTINGTTGLTFPNASQQTTASFSGAATNVVSSSPITLISSSPQYQVAQISSFTNSYVTLPDATQVGLGSNPYVIENRSPYGANLELRNNAGTSIGYIPIGQIATVQLKDASTAAGQWAVELVNPQVLFKYDTASITNVTTTPVPPGFNYGLVGLTATTFVRWWFIGNPAAGTGTVVFYTQVGVISGSSISFGSIQSSTIFSSLTASGIGIYARVIRLSNTAFTVLVGENASYSDACGTSYGAQQRIYVCTVSGTVVTFGTASSASMPSLSQIGGTPGLDQQALSLSTNGTICRLSDTSFALFYNDGTNTTYSSPYNYAGSMSCQIVTVSGVTLTIGTKVTLATSTYTQVLSAVGLSSTSAFLCYAQATATGGSTGRTKIIVVSVSGTVPTFNTPVSCESSDTACFGPSSVAFVDGALSPSTSQVIFNTGYNMGECTISGTVPTFDSFPYSSRLTPIFLSTSSKAWTGSSLKYYLSIATGGFVTNTNGVNILQTNSAVTNAIPWSPLGAQPTTSYVAYSATAPGNVSSSTVILGTTT